MLVILLVASTSLVAACGGGSGDRTDGGGSPRPRGAQAGDQELISGRSVYIANCARCHGSRGEGRVGPRLADRVVDRYPNIEDQKDVVREGRGIMPSFSGQLTDEEIDAVVRYEREVL